MPSMKFPLRWESTGDQWWFASPIDYAAANGQYDIVRQLLHLDSNNLIKLTSLQRTRRLETVWDDDDQFHNVANNRSKVARKLLIETDSKRGKSSLIQAGYGGWLLYTAASAGDLSFIQELLARDSLLVFGEGEYGVTDILYAAAKSKNSQAFKVILDFATYPRFGTGENGEREEHIREVPTIFKDEMMNRAIFAAARGGNADVLKELLGKDSCSDVLAYRDFEASTILHAAAGKGQLEVVKYLTQNFDICNTTDNQGNTALHIAAYQGQLAVVELLIAASPSSILQKNYSGETYLHMSMSGFKTRTFRRMDKQVDFLKKLVDGEIFRLEDIINEKNNEGRTVLHTAIIGNIHIDLVQLLMSVRYIDVNARDLNLMTPLDHLKRRPRSASLDLLSDKLVSAGGILGSKEKVLHRAMTYHLKVDGTHSRSPGTSFQISDTEILLHTGQQNVSVTSCNGPRNSCSRDLTQFGHPAAPSNLSGLLQKLEAEEKEDEKNRKAENLAYASLPSKMNKAKEIPMSLRQRHINSSSPSSPSGNKRTVSFADLKSPAPSSKKKSVSHLKQGILEAMPRLFLLTSFSSSAPQSHVTSSSHGNTQKNEQDMTSSSHNKHKLSEKFESFNKKFKERYLCSGPAGILVKDGAIFARSGPRTIVAV